MSLELIPLSPPRPPPGETPWIGPSGEVMERLELHITYHCPERCVFCSEEHRMAAFHPYPVTFSRVAQTLREQRSRGVQAVHFTGGEPTLHPQFGEILALAKKLGMRTSVGTIGTRLADPSFAALVMPHLDEALFSLHGPSAGVHDPLTGRSGSFERVVRAVALAKQFRPGFRPFVNSVVNRHNVSHLLETVRFVRQEVGASLLILSNVTPEGGGEDHYDDLAVPLSTWRELAEGVIAEAGSDLIVRFFGLPLCALGEARMHANDLHWNPRVTVEWARHPASVSLDGIYSWTPDRKRTHGPPCLPCRYREVCFGVFQAYTHRHGWDELIPWESQR